MVDPGRQPACAHQSAGERIRKAVTPAGQVGARARRQVAPFDIHVQLARGTRTQRALAQDDVDRAGDRLHAQLRRRRPDNLDFLDQFGRERL